MNTKTIKFLMAGLLGLAGISLGAFALNNEISAEPVLAVSTPGTTYANGDADTYYNEISIVKEGQALLTDLYNLNHSKRKTEVGYSGMGTSVSGLFRYTDYDPTATTKDDNGQVYGTRVLSFYSGASTTNWNREHVWPASRLPGGRDHNIVDPDIYMPRPTISSENTSRGNAVYCEGKADSSNGWDPIEDFGINGCYGGTSIRGECARIIFYCCTVDNRIVLNQETDNDGNNMGVLTDLLKWNLENPVNEREINRNEGGEYLQGNRNAFVDHPEYACKIWGNYNEETKKICGQALTPPTTITLSATPATIAVGSKLTIGVTVDKGSSTVIWDSSDKTVATVNEGVVTGIKAGTAEISARSALDPNVVGKITITVKAVKDLAVSGTPIKTTYTAGEDFDPTGLTITATYTDNSSENVTSLVTWEPTPLYQGLTYVTGKYSGKSIVINGLTVEKGAPSSNVTISFKNNSADGSAELSKSDILKEIIDGSSFVQDVSNASKIYSGKNGLKIGSSKQNGSLTINLNKQLSNVKQIKVTAAKYNSDDSQLKINNQTIDIDDTVLKEYTVNLSANISKLEISSMKRTYLSSITVVCENSSSDDDKVHVTGVTLDKTEANIEVGSTLSLTATVLPNNATDKSVTWESSDTAVATVTNGTVTAVSNGLAIITVKSVDGNITDQCQITVTGGKTPVAVTGVSLNKTEVALKVEDTETLVATINPTDAENKNVIWTTSDANVATVNNGVVTAIAKGEATITVTTVEGGFTATCKVTVVNKDEPLPTPSKKGCTGSIIASSAIVSATSLIGVILLSIKRKKED